jgi:hypothetical protein
MRECPNLVGEDRVKYEKEMAHLKKAFKSTIGEYECDVYLTTESERHRKGDDAEFRDGPSPILVEPSH